MCVPVCERMGCGEIGRRFESSSERGRATVSVRVTMVVRSAK
jgi:hypothetical protein